MIESVGFMKKSLRVWTAALVISLESKRFFLLREASYITISCLFIAPAEYNGVIK